MQTQSVRLHDPVLFFKQFGQIRIQNMLNHGNRKHHINGLGWNDLRTRAQKAANRLDAINDWRFGRAAMRTIKSVNVDTGILARQMLKYPGKTSAYLRNFLATEILQKIHCNNILNGLQMPLEIRWRKQLFDARVCRIPLFGLVYKSQHDERLLSEGEPGKLKPRRN